VFSCYREGAGFALQDSLQNGTPIHVGPQLSTFNGLTTEGVNLDKLVFFPLSVLWRGSIHRWNHNGRTIDLPLLGDRYNEELRKYLLGVTGFPPNVAIQITVSSVKPPLNLCVFPYGSKNDGCYHYRFAIPGIEYTIWVGGNIPPIPRRICAVNSPEHFILLSQLAENRIIADAVDSFIK
jgi:hypothetical protein